MDFYIYLVQHLKYVRLTDHNEEIHPFVAISFPWTDQFKSALAVKHGTDTYTWDDKCMLPRTIPSLNHLHQEYLNIYIYSNKAGPKVTGATLLGSVSLDLYSIASGPAKHRVKLSHAKYDSELEFECYSKETTNTVITIKELTVAKVQKEFVTIALEMKVGDAPYKLVLPTFHKLQSQPDWKLDTSKDKYSLTIPITYEQVSSGNAKIDFNYYTQVQGEKGELQPQKVGCHQLDLKSLFEAEQSLAKVEASFDVKSKLTDLLTCSLEVTPFPTFVQSVNGQHIYNGNCHSYINITTIPHAILGAEKPMTSFTGSEPACFPPNSNTSTIDEVTFNMKVNTITCTSSEDIPNLKIIMYAINSFNTKLITMSKLPGNKFVAPVGTLSLQYKTKQLYELHHKYMICEAWNADQSIYYGDFYLSLHNLFSGPKKYVDVKLEHGTIHPTISLNFNVEVNYSRKYYLMFKEIIIENLNAQKGAAMIGAKLGNSTTTSQCEKGEKSGKVAYSCAELDGLVIEVINDQIVDKKDIEVAVSDVGGCMKNVLAKGRIGCDKFIPLKHSRDFTMKLDGKGIDGSKPINMSFTLLAYTNIDHNGLYHDYVQSDKDQWINHEVHSKEANSQTSTVISDYKQHVYHRKICEYNPHQKEEINESNNVDNNEPLSAYRKESSGQVLSSSIKCDSHCNIIVTPKSVQVYKSNNELITEFDCSCLHVEYSDLVLEIMSNQGNMTFLTNDAFDLYQQIQHLVLYYKKHQDYVASVPPAPSTADDTKKLVNASFSPVNNTSSSSLTSPNAYMPEMYHKCKCGKILQLHCVTCQKPCNNLTTYEAYPVTCSSCNKITNIMKLIHGDKIMTKCNYCHSDCGNIPIINASLKCLRCAKCGGFISLRCPSCNAVPDKLSIVYRVQCQVCDQYGLVGKPEQRCPKCNTPYIPFKTVV